MRNNLTFLMSVLVGLLFLTGMEFNIGVGDNEPTSIPFPKSGIAGWFCVAFGILWLVPPWILARILRLIKRIKQGPAIAKQELLKRIEKAEG